MNRKLLFLALGATAVMAVSCEKDNNSNVIDSDVDLVGDITEDRTLEQGQTYDTDHRAGCDYHRPG